MTKKLISNTDFSNFLKSYQKPTSGWPQVILMLAGIYNILFGLWAVFCPSCYLGADVASTSLWQCIGMIVGVYGIGYLIASSDIDRYWPLIFVGLLGKIFGPIGFIYTLFIGEAKFSTFILIIFNDLIWLVPFLIILLKVLNRHWREKNEISLLEDSSNYKEKYKSILEASKDSKMLLVFVRHLGCIFCQEAISVLKNEIKELNKNGYKVVLFHMEGQDELEKIFNGEEIQIIEDKNQVFYSIFGVPRVGLYNAFGPHIFLEALKVIPKVKPKLPVLRGDGFQLASCMVIEKSKIIKEHVSPDVRHKISYLEFVLSDSKNDPDEKLTLFYDNDCTACSIEISLLMSLIPSGKVDFIDISSKEFDPGKYGKSYSELMSQIYAQKENGDWIYGMEVFRELYSCTPYGGVVAITGLPIIKEIADFKYKLFAKYRTKIFPRKCEVKNT